MSFSSRKKVSRCPAIPLFPVSPGSGVPSICPAPSRKIREQQEQHDQQEEQKAKPAQDEKKAQPKKSTEQGNKNGQQEEKNTQQQDRNKNQEEKSAQQQDENNQQENRNAQQRSQPYEPAQQAQRGNAGRIPDDRYRANFGQEHRFRVSQADYSNRRFQYGGYSFRFVDAWPSNWLYTQDVFVVEIGGVYS